MIACSGTHDLAGRVTIILAAAATFMKRDELLILT